MTPEIRQKLIDRFTNTPYAKYLQIELLTLEPGLIEARMPLSAEHQQYSGVVHGGVLAALADTIAGFACYTVTPPENDVLVAELKISFLRAGCGKELLAKGTVLKPGRNIHFWECEIYCNDKLVCKATGTFSVVHKQV